MKKFLKEKIGTIIFLILVIGLVAYGFLKIQKAKENAITYSNLYDAPEANVDTSDPGKFVSVAKTEHTELFFNFERGTIQVKDLDTGFVWKGYCDDEDYDMKSISKKWRAYLQSSITITYNDLKKRDASPQKVNSYSDATWMETEVIENGVACTYGFLKPGIFVTVEYTLEGDELVVRVPYEKIREEHKYAITMMEILPFLGACSNDEDGYMFYPDGSGAITDFSKAGERTASSTVSYFYTYSNRYLSYENIYDPDIQDRYAVCFPVYGIKRGDNAIFAAVTEGEAAAGIQVYPSGCNNVKLNHIGFQVDLRNVFIVDMYSMSTGNDSKATGGTIQRIDKAFIPETRECRYFFLSGDEANYSGMASIYRDYLLESGKLQDVIEDDAQMPLALSILCGAVKEGMVFRQYIPMSTTDNVIEMVDTLKNDGISNMEVILDAWQSDGNFYNEYWPASSKIGGNRGLSDINDYSEANEDLNIYLAQDFTFVYKKTDGLDATNDVAYNGIGIEVSLEFVNGDTGYLLNADAVEKRNNSLLKKLNSMSTLGIAYSTLGTYAFADSNPDHTFTKQQMADKISEILKTTSDDGRKVASLGANMYVLKSADYLYGLKEDAYGLSITDYSVPFLEMVISGSIPYSTDGVGNLSYDLQYQKLKWIEYGASPRFTLTYESALNLKETNYANLFSSTFVDWKDRVENVYNEMNDNLGDEYGHRIVEHQYLTDELVRIVYDNGTKVYINYGTKALSRDGVKVPANDYVVVKGGD